MPVRKKAWLSLTPEPERVLPHAIAALRAGDEPSPEAVAAESRRAERLVVGASRRRWRRWLAEVRRLAERGEAARPADARLARDVIENHDALGLGIADRSRGLTTQRGRNPR
jgi:hypothetical protein